MSDAESAGGTLESIYWILGDRDGLAIVDVPDSVSAAAVSLAVLTGALTRARELTSAFRPPGQGG